jgi:hypothetical protein
MRDSVLNTWKTKFNETPIRQSLVGLPASHQAQHSVHRDSTLMRKFQFPQGFLCEFCISQYEKEKLSSYYDEDDSMAEEEMDMIGFDLNPDMEEEKYCNSCSKKRKNTPAICLNNGQPSCLDCLNKAFNSNEESVLGSMNILNDSGIQNSAKSVDKKFTYKRMMSEAHSISKISERIKSVEYSKIDSINNGQKNKINKPNISMNLNNIYEEEEPKTTQLTPNNNAKKRLSIFEYSNKEINSKIMNLVSPRNSVDIKFRKNVNLNQIEKICKSLDYIFENPTPKVAIHLPFIYDGSKTVNECDWTKKLDTNGNYLFSFLDSREEFLFGLVCNTFSDKKLAKLFKKIPDIGKSKSSIEYCDHIFDSLTITQNLLLIDGYLSYDIENRKLSLDNNKLLKFFLSSHSRQDMTAQINLMNIYDMC